MRATGPWQALAVLSLLLLGGVYGAPRSLLQAQAEEQQQALLQLKQAVDPGSKLPWPAGSDKCSWKGVNCNGNGLVTSV